LLILGCTFWLHRRRQWVLTAPQGLRSFAFKYAPVVVSLTVYESLYAKRISVDDIDVDFAAIEQ
jgi:hypothetical protein